MGEVWLNPVALVEVELDNGLKGSFISAAITEKGVQVLGSSIGGSSGLLDNDKPGGNVELEILKALKAPSSPPRYGTLGFVMLNAER